MVQQLPQRDIGGDIGRAFSQSLSEQLPREMQASRLAQAYQDLQKQDVKPGQSPDFSKILSVPGGLESLNSLLPMLRQKWYADTNQPQGNAPGTGQPEKGGLPMAQDEKEVAQEKQKFFKTAEQLQKASAGFLQPPSAGDFYYDLKQRDFENEQNNFARGEQVASQGISQILQQEGLKDFSKVEGDLLENISSQMKVLIHNGMSPEAAFQTLKPDIQKISRDLTALRGKKLTGAGVEGNIINTYKRFQEKGLQHRFPQYAADIFEVPVSKITSIIEPSRNEKFNNILKKTGKLGAIKEKIGTKPFDYNKLIDAIQPEDNLTTLMYNVLKEGLNVDQFVKDLSRNDSKLTDEQKEQVRDAPNWMDQLSSNWFDFTHKKTR